MIHMSRSSLGFLINFKRAKEVLRPTCLRTIKIDKEQKVGGVRRMREQICDCLFDLEQVNQPLWPHLPSEDAWHLQVPFIFNVLSLLVLSQAQAENGNSVKSKTPSPWILALSTPGECHREGCWLKITALRPRGQRAPPRVGGEGWCQLLEQSAFLGCSGLWVTAQEFRSLLCLEKCHH